MRPGPRNSITDVAGIKVGNAEDVSLKSGVSVVVCDEPAIAACQVLGGAPGTRETDLLEPHNTVQAVDAIVLSGGSAFGLDAASGAQSALAEDGRGFAVGPARVPIVPAAILFDLLNGGDKSWGRYPPYRELGYDAVRNAGLAFRTGSAGAGTGALTAGLKGGLGTASAIEGGMTIGVLVAVNALGSATIASSRHFWAAPFEEGNEFGGLGMPHPFPQGARTIRTKMGGKPAEMRNTTIAVIATDALLTKAEAKRLAIAAHDGFARALWPAHTPFDGDIVFALATGKSGVKPDERGFVTLCALAASTMARAIARGVHDATPMDGDTLPVWSQSPPHA
ncbi:L-aminopeptidase/D-esterase-like protein [Pararhizobium capsulatum DSM 1112]|uniref:L-aminopeptidase/D-esterase-like protein n=1 Tax=Pararhizobium capsulatum DSM 1112 TaxID=1121113 RepID=A0ABU0BQD1_9HYPH|nr:P1 family peptidase [Pararhizobium capsulatum]MDQ0320461.1 L-aminopeptidase/D-esterase-like protein [Pararhizobium capsulatum DSM 1112]